VIEKLPFVNEPGFQHAVSFSIGQNIYTPEDLERSDLIQDDRPYAVITYLAIGLHSKNSHRMDSLELDLGIVGPYSYAEQC
jgi:lipid A 3-O-deacylase